MDKNKKPEQKNGEVNNNQTNQKVDQTTQNNQQNNSNQQTTKNGETDKNKPNNLIEENKKLLKENLELKDQVSKTQLRIKELENQLHNFNLNYKQELNAKEQLAQAKVQEKIKEYQEKFDKDVAHIKKYALKDKASELISIISNFEAAVSSEVKDPVVANYLKGFQMFNNMFKSYLENNGIKEIDVKVNDDFNEHLMQAFETKKENGVAPHKVIKVVKKGYKLHDVVLMPALVIVSK